jgi:hypothetical protein
MAPRRQVPNKYNHTDDEHVRRDVVGFEGFVIVVGSTAAAIVGFSDLQDLPSSQR